MEMDGMLGTIELVGQTDWLAILPSALCYADKDGRLRKLNVLNDPPMTFDYVIVEKTETPLPNAAALLAQHLTHHTKLILEDWADLRLPAIA
jgi:DNA-binding transcriptional LysR family regulator